MFYKFSSKNFFIPRYATPLSVPQISTSTLCPLGAGIAGIMFFWIAGEKYVEVQVNKGRENTFTKLYFPICKYIYVPICILVLVLGIALGGIG